jgi:hypothetical protein
MNTRKPYLLIVLSLSIPVLSGCSFENIGKKLGQGVSTQTDTIGHNLAQGLRDELTDPGTAAKFSQLADSIVSSLMDDLSRKVLVLRDSLTNRKILNWADSLLEALTGNQLKLNMEKVQAALIGKTKTDAQDIKNIFSKFLIEILSNKTKDRLGSFRDELLGDKTNKALTRIADTLVSHIVDSALVKLSNGLRKDINPQVQGDISFVSKNASFLLILLGGIAVLIIFLVWRSRVKYLRLATLLTKHINTIPDQKIYDRVTSDIKEDAIVAGLESHLRDLLRMNNLLGENAWKVQAEKMRNR